MTIEPLLELDTKEIDRMIRESQDPVLEEKRRYERIIEIATKKLRDSSVEAKVIKSVELHDQERYSDKLDCCLRTCIVCGTKYFGGPASICGICVSVYRDLKK